MKMLNCIKKGVLLSLIININSYQSVHIETKREEENKIFGPQEIFKKLSLQNSDIDDFYSKYSFCIFSPSNLENFSDEIDKNNDQELIKTILLESIDFSRTLIASLYKQDDKSFMQLFMEEEQLDMYSSSNDINQLSKFIEKAKKLNPDMGDLKMPDDILCNIDENNPNITKIIAINKILKNFFCVCMFILDKKVK